VKVTIIGAGNMGRGIGTRTVAGGNDLQILDRDPAEAQALAADLADVAGGRAPVAAGEPGDELTGDVVVLALYYPGIKDAAEEYRDRLAGRVVVDISNPIDFETFAGLATPGGTSAAEEIQALLPEGTSVVKAFNTTFWRTLVDGEVDGQRLDVFVAGDDATAKQQVGSLIESGGLRAIDVGALGRAAQLEHLGFLVIAVQEPLGLGFRSAIRLHP
jgi:NADPH-dependent F420 reductase